MRMRYPTALEPVHDNYNALAIGFGPTERFRSDLFHRTVPPMPRDYSHAGFLDTTLTVAAGTHEVSVYAAGRGNSLQRKDYSITVK
jgi:hypothetical protein